MVKKAKSDAETSIFYRRRLPHWQPPGAVLFLTWRLRGSLPSEAIARLIEKREQLQGEPVRPEETEKERDIRHAKILFQLMDEMLDRVHCGPKWLEDERVARIVTDALFYYDGHRYDLYGFAVMGNHVHLILRPRLMNSNSSGAQEVCYWPVWKITGELKGYTAREANRLLGRVNQPFWQEESYDHWIRNAEEFRRILDYIEFNPVRAGLVRAPEDWRWSSAWERRWGRLKGRGYPEI